VKVRKSFVTNSSSTSYTIIYEINDCKELRDYLADEYGKFGIKIADEYFIKDIEHANDEDLLEYLDEDNYDLEKTYLKACFVIETTEGMVEGDDAFLANIVPDEYKKEIYNDEE